MTMQQRKDESLRSFIVRFNEQLVGVLYLIIPLITTALFKGLNDEHFKISLSKNAPKTMMELRLQTEKYINAKKALQTVDEINLTDLNPERASIQPLSAEERIEPSQGQRAGEDT